MADAPQKVNTPDGREWLVSIEGRKRSMKETRETPFFWAHVVVTAIIAGVFIWIFRHNTGILWILVVATVVIWAVGFLGSTFGVMIRADTAAAGTPSLEGHEAVCPQPGRTGCGCGDTPRRADRRAFPHATRRDLTLSSSLGCGPGGAVVA